ncbi:hypothetical protein [Micromonospora sp. NPDC005324]|uniref:hypothetical protein n=1 Tax=Micromonospora sp. NPDC005324 TaxID=3157033 RepID=UPI0033A09719
MNGRPTPHLDAVKAERDKLAATVQRVRDFADELALYCSPHGMAADYAQRLREVLSEPDPDAVQRMLDDATQAFADASTGSERREVIRDLLAGWYAAWPPTAVTDPHEGIAFQLVALVYAAEARAVACPCLPGAPKHQHGVGGYATDQYDPADDEPPGRPIVTVELPGVSR